MSLSYKPNTADVNLGDIKMTLGVTSHLEDAQKVVCPKKESEDGKVWDIDVTARLPEMPVHEILEDVPVANEETTAIRIEDGINADTSIQESPFLALPYEIRRHIYLLLLKSHTVHHAHLTSPTNTRPAASNFQPLAFGLPSALSSPSLARRNPHNRPRGKISTGLLLSCKQTYMETHRLPFEENEFVFINWFSSGNYAGCEFSRCLASWQREAMRYVGIEVLARDLVPKAEAKSEWETLCSLWMGVRGLRLGIKGSVDIPHLVKGSVLDPDTRWVTRGLVNLRALRWLELEIEDCVGREVKLEFVRLLQSTINSDRREDEFVKICLCDGSVGNGEAGGIISS